MKSKEQLIKDSIEIAKQNAPSSQVFFDIAFEKAYMLAEEYNADKDIVLIGLSLMDIKLQEAKKKGDISKHVLMASEFSSKFLKDYDITKEEFNKIINCIEAHHGKISFDCIESEIVANADCYRFIHPLGAFSYLGILANRSNDTIQNIKQLEFKQKEKYNMLSLEKAKEELYNYYDYFSKLFNFETE